MEVQWSTRHCPNSVTVCSDLFAFIAIAVDIPHCVFAVMEVNYFGVVAITQKFLPLIRQHKGRIINISSVAGFAAGATVGVYSASKFALEALTDSLRRELTPLGVAVVSVNPAFVKTKIGDKSAASYKAVSAEARQVYSHCINDKQAEQLEQMVAKGDEPTVTTEAIETALTSPKPNDRYVVANVDGAPAWLITKFIRILPTHLMDIISAPKK
jgi:NAD(P)-dependent dehydrogenase (short-subunit alcohol dehydrogenase family)